ncbi:uncharacterized protein DDB_G0271670 [Drosophila hydei]|uniref:Uncharacterized protein DDB_G0271670 n=1 Tax=Drosophila hydei TaxID=7224 RepID=A0A6J2T0B3_DROHY|nr:uncharacterized protein DDB_G0271670 [Drosophila hydei]
MSEGNRKYQMSAGSGKRKANDSPPDAALANNNAKKPKKKKGKAKQNEPEKWTHNVERILEKRYVSGRAQLLLKWVGYPIEESTWEPIENLSGDCMIMLADFEAALYSKQCQKPKHQAAEPTRSLNTSQSGSTESAKENKQQSCPVMTPQQPVNVFEAKHELQKRGEQSELQREQQRPQQKKQLQMHERELREQKERSQLLQKPPGREPQVRKEQSQLQTKSKMPKLCKDLMLSSDSSGNSSSSDSDSESSSGHSSSSSSGSGSGSNSSSSGGSSSSSSSESEEEIVKQPKPTPNPLPVPKPNPFFNNLNLPPKLNLSSDDDSDDEPPPPAPKPISVVDHNNIITNSIYARTSIESLKEQARKWHDRRAADRNDNVPVANATPPKQPSVPQTQRQVEIPKLSSVSPEIPKLRRQTMHSSGIEEVMEQMHESDPVEKPKVPSQERSRNKQPKSSRKSRFNSVGPLPCLDTSPKPNDNADKILNHLEVVNQRNTSRSPIIKELAVEHIKIVSPMPNSPIPIRLPSTPKTPEKSSISSRSSSSGGSSARSNKSARAPSSSSNSHARPMGNWDDALQLPARPQGIERGLALEKILKSFKMRGETYLVVKWKAISVLDAVSLSGVIELYPHIVIEYFEKLQLRCPLD